MEKHLHIISLTVPYPVDYGGVFDLFYKLTALQQQGVRIHLHCFDYGRGKQTELDKYCESVHYYQRQGYELFSSLPHIIYSRKNEVLFQRLLEDDHPILMEGIHCSYLLNDDRFNNRKLFVRLHNIESDYYRDLKKTATSALKKLYYRRESNLLQRYEKRIANKATFLSVTEKDATDFKTKYHCHSVSYLPLFLPGWKVTSNTGIGAYCLYQGDLSVDANVKMVEWIVKKVFSETTIPLKIAGKNPPGRLKKIINGYDHISIIENPGESQMQQLITEAHINIIPSFSNTGIKLKLLNALFNGRHCVVNKATVEGTGFEHLCHIADTTDHLKNLLAQLYHQPFREDEVQARKTILEYHFNNDVNAKKLVQLIWNQ